MISNTGSTLLVYSTEHIRVKVYTGRGPRQRFQSACGDAPSDAFLAGAIQSAARSGRFSVEAGTRAAAPFPAPLSPLAALCLRCAPDKFLLTKQTLSSTIEKPASLRSDGVRDHPGMPFGFPPEQAFSFAGIPTHSPHFLFQLGAAPGPLQVHRHIDDLANERLARRLITSARMQPVFAGWIDLLVPATPSL